MKGGLNMAEKENNILKSIKKGLLIVDDDTVFDSQIIMFINSALSELQQVGYLPARDFEIETGEETWDELIKEKRFNMVKTYIMEKVHLLFDPPASSWASGYLKDDIEELAHRIRYEVETGG